MHSQITCDAEYRSRTISQNPIVATLEAIQSRLLEAGVVVGAHVVDPVDLQPPVQQALAQVGTDETRSAGDQHARGGGRLQQVHGSTPSVTGR